MDQHLKEQVEGASANLAEAFSDWHTKANKPEQDLNMQEVSDAWDLLILQEEHYRMATASLRGQKEGCEDCPDEHDHDQRVRDA